MRYTETKILSTFSIVANLYVNKYFTLINDLIFNNLYLLPLLSGVYDSNCDLQNIYQKCLYI